MAEIEVTRIDEHQVMAGEHCVSSWIYGAAQEESELIRRRAGLLRNMGRHEKAAAYLAAAKARLVEGTHPDYR